MIHIMRFVSRRLGVVGSICHKALRVVPRAHPFKQLATRKKESRLVIFLAGAASAQNAMMDPNVDSVVHITCEGRSDVRRDSPDGHAICNMEIEPGYCRISFTFTRVLMV